LDDPTVTLQAFPIRIVDGQVQIGN
jgi:hypothetical protein